MRCVNVNVNNLHCVQLSEWDLHGFHRICRYLQMDVPCACGAGYPQLSTFSENFWIVCTTHVPLQLCWLSAVSVLSLGVCENRDGWLVAWGLCGCMLIRFSAVWLLPFTLL